jgi:nicotinate-nucleotide adenylyltransferase
MSPADGRRRAALGLFGGAFDPPHRGHVELARTAKQALGLERLLVVVAEAPGHKPVDTPAATRLRLARAAFPGDEIVLDDHPRTVDALRAHPEWRDAVFLVGADQFCDLPSWKEPNAVLELVWLGVATRPGFAHERLQPVLERLERPERILFFDIDPIPVASSELRERLELGEDVGDDLPAAVAEIVRAEGLYETSHRYTGSA